MLGLNLSLPHADPAQAARRSALTKRQHVRLAGGKADAAPEIVFIEVASVCNLACSMCKLSNAAYVNTKPDFLSSRVCEQLLDGLPHGIRCINLQGLGEPLLNPQFPELVASCKRKAPLARVTINTNGVLLGRWARDLVACGLDELYVSINSANPAIFAESRGGASIRAVVDNIRALREAQQSLARPTPDICFRTVAVRGTNYDDLIHLAKDLGVSRIAFQEMGLDGEWIRPEGHPHPPEATELEFLFTVVPDRAHQVGIDVDFFWPSRYIPCVCTAPWGTLNVLSNGEVTPCCALNDPHRGVIGNAFTTPLHAVWDGDALQRFRVLFVEGKQAACSDCPLYRPWLSLSAES